MADVNCCDCGGWDIEWMYRCHKHGTEYCRGCECVACLEEDDEDYSLEDLGQPGEGE